MHWSCQAVAGAAKVSYGYGSARHSTCMTSRMLPEGKGRVLVVDDEPAIRALVAKIVERAGFSVDVAADGAEAIAKVNQTDYAVIVLDLMMPAVSGYEFVEFLEQRGGKRPSVIVITAA